MAKSDARAPKPSGTATAIVFATGAGTSFGDVVTRLAARPEETELERGTHRFGTVTGEFQVLALRATRIGVALDLHDHVRHARQGLGELGELRFGVATERAVVGAKEHIPTHAGAHI